MRKILTDACVFIKIIFLILFCRIILFDLPILNASDSKEYELGFEVETYLESDQSSFDEDKIEKQLDLTPKPFLVSDRGEDLIKKALPILYEAVKKVYPDSYQEFLSGWNIQEVMRFLNSFNHSFLKPKQSLSKSAKKFSGLNTQKVVMLFDSSDHPFLKPKPNLSKSAKKKRVKGFIPIFSEIFEGIKFFKEAELSDDNEFFVAEFLLDLPFNFKTTSPEHSKRHDGASISIKGRDVYVYKISEAKEGGKYRTAQGLGVFERWTEEGLYIYDTSFSPEHLFLVLNDDDNGDQRIVNIKEASFEDFQSITEVGGTNFKRENLDRPGFKGSFFDIARVVGGHKKLELVGKQMLQILNKVEKARGLSGMYLDINKNLVSSVIEDLILFVQTHGRLPSFESTSMNEKLLRLSLYYVLYTPSIFVIDTELQSKYDKILHPLVSGENIFAPNMQYLRGFSRDKKCVSWFR